MHDQRIVKLLIRNPKGKFLILRSAGVYAQGARYAELPSAVAQMGEDDVAVLDRAVRDDLGIFLQTQEALQIGFDSEYEPGEGVMTRVLYMLKIPGEYLNITLGERYEKFEWRSASEMRDFDPANQVLVQTALDFYVPGAE